MEEKDISLPIKFSNIEEINPMISTCMINICYDTDDTNGFEIPESTIEGMFTTMKGSRILGTYMYAEVNGEEYDDFMGHEGDRVKIGSQWVSTGESKNYGFIDYMNNPKWETMKDENGKEHKYCCVRGFLWTGVYPELYKLNENKNWQSMEITLRDYVILQDGRIRVNDATFLGCCILGEKVAPAFTGSRVQLFSSQKSKDEFTEMFSKSKTIIEEYFSHNETFLDKEKRGSKPSAKINLTKESATDNPSWGSVDKSSLLNSILERKNWRTLINKAYLVVDKSTLNDSPSSSCHYPICILKDDSLVYHIGGVKSALSFLEKEKDKPYYNSAISKLKKIYNKLGLETDSFSSVDNIEENNKHKEVFADMENMKKKMSDMYKNMKNCCSSNYASYDDETMYAMDNENKQMYALKDNKICRMAYNCYDDEEHEEIEPNDEDSEENEVDHEEYKKCMGAFRKCMSSHLDSLTSEKGKYSLEVEDFKKKLTDKEKELEDEKKAKEEMAKKNKELEDDKNKNKDDKEKELEKEKAEMAKKVLDLESEFDTYKKDMEAKMSRLNELEEEKATIEKEKKFSLLKSTLDENTKYLNDEEFKTFSEKLDSYETVDCLETEINKIIATKVKSSNFSANNNNKTNMNNMFVANEPEIEGNDNGWNSFVNKYNK